MIYLLISREVDYTLRMLRTLSDGQLHVAKELCERECIPHKFSYKIIRKLSDAGLIHATRGVGGGIRLIADLKSYTLYDLLEITDPGQHISACTSLGYRCEWREKDRSHCSFHMHLMEIERDIHEILKQKNLHTLLSEPAVSHEANGTMK